MNAYGYNPMLGTGAINLQPAKPKVGLSIGSALLKGIAFLAPIAGAIIGSVIPGAGTIVGGMIGSAIGSAVGGLAGMGANALDKANYEQQLKPVLGQLQAQNSQMQANALYMLQQSQSMTYGFGNY